MEVQLLSPSCLGSLHSSVWLHSACTGQTAIYNRYPVECRIRYIVHKKKYNLKIILKFCKVQCVSLFDHLKNFLLLTSFVVRLAQISCI